MDKEHKNLLQKNYKFLVDHLDAIESICDELIQDGILTTGMKDGVISKTPKPKAQARQLLDDLPKRGPNAFCSFIKALKETKNEFIAERICPGISREEKTLCVQVLPASVEKTPDVKLKVLATPVCINISDLTKHSCNISQKDIRKTTEESFRKILEEHKPGKDMKEFLKQQTLDNNYDSLILVILCGGIDFEPSKIYDGNGYEVSLEDIVDIVKNSEGFKYKPKIIILQTYSFKGMKTQLDDIDSNGQRFKFDKENTEDLFVVAAYPKIRHDPWMRGNNAKGSYFIQTLAYVMKNNSHSMSLVEMMQEVQKCLSNDDKETSQTTVEAVAEVVFMTNSLLRELFIFPGINCA